ncbi:hypothetical protein KAR91_23660 [Candidatus Pacearchaeota archaeon]|nr:hypothetical protein [Candidatus Pacearchaeota archaeon]
MSYLESYKKRIAQLENEGWTILDISNECGLNTETVRRWVDKYGLREKRRAELRQSIIDYYQGGWSSKRIMNRFKTSRHKIDEVLRDAKIEKRTPIQIAILKRTQYSSEGEDHD